MKKLKFSKDYLQKVISSIANIFIQRSGLSDELLDTSIRKLFRTNMIETDPSTRSKKLARSGSTPRRFRTILYDGIDDDHGQIVSITIDTFPFRKKCFDRVRHIVKKMAGDNTMNYFNKSLYKHSDFIAALNDVECNYKMDQCGTTAPMILSSVRDTVIRSNKQYLCEGINMKLIVNELHCAGVPNNYISFITGLSESTVGSMIFKSDSK